MKDLFKAIYAKFTGSTGADLYANLTGGLHNTQAPQDTDYPYAVFYLISGIPHWTFDNTMENVIIQFTIYDDNSSVENVSDLYGYLTDLYDWTVLDIDNYHSIYMKRETSSLMKSSDIWQQTVDYRIEIEEEA